MDFNEPSWQHESTVCASLRVVAESCVRSHAQTQEQNNKTNHLDKTLLKFLQPQILLSPENIYNINALKIIAGSNQSCPLVWVFTRPPTPTPCFLVPSLLPQTSKHSHTQFVDFLLACFCGSGTGTDWLRSLSAGCSLCHHPLLSILSCLHSLSLISCVFTIPYVKRHIYCPWWLQ